MSEVADKVEKLSVEEPKTEETTSVGSTALASTDFSVIHPLTHKWTFWYLKPAQGHVENWSDLLKELVTVNSVEEFWGAYNSIPKVTEVPMKADFAFFREGIRPEWEDAANAQGGKWIAQLHLNEEVDAKWLNLLLSLIGGTLDNEASECINGVFVMVRPRATARVQMWVKDNNATESMAAAAKLKNVLNLDKQKIEFQAHNSKKDGPSLKIEL